MSILNYHIRLVEYDIQYREILTDLPISDPDQKKQLISELGITYESLQKNKEYREIEVKYSSGKRKLRKEISDDTKNILNYSVKELFVNESEFKIIMNIIRPGVFSKMESDHLWKLCFTKSIQQEFYYEGE